MELEQTFVTFAAPTKEVVAIFVRLLSFGLGGINALPVQVEVDVCPGIPCFEIVGLPDAAVRESRERVRAAIRNGGWRFPSQRITVNLAPAHTRKGGAGFDLAIALGVLAASGHIDPHKLQRLAFAGELALDGTLRPVRGALAMAMAASGAQAEGLIIPAENGLEAAAQMHFPVYAASHLNQVVEHLGGDDPLPRVHGSDLPPPQTELGADLANVHGQLIGRRALEIAAAGMHNLFMVGPPGAGKSLLAQCLPGILPPLEPKEALEVSQIHSIAGRLLDGRLVTQRPFRVPHHSATRAALLGGGSPLRPGEITLAHRGILFLDELPEYRRDVLEGLRQPLEEGRISLARANGEAGYPARFMLVAAANPCPCGFLSDPTHACICSPAAMAVYRSRFSGPLLDRFDIQLFLAPVPFEQVLQGQSEGGAEPSAVVQERVKLAVAVQRKRFLGTNVHCNREMTVQQVKGHCKLTAAAERILRQGAEQMGLSLRGYHRVLKVARTIADLASCELIGSVHVAEALQYRALSGQVQRAQLL